MKNLIATKYVQFWIANNVAYSSTVTRIIEKFQRIGFVTDVKYTTQVCGGGTEQTLSY